MDYFYSSQQRNHILNSLQENQQNYLLEKLKRSKRTIFSNELVKGKGTFSGSDQELEQEIQEWEFVDLLDAGEGRRIYKCECGMSLRFQYIVRNMKTGEIKKFGKTHFEFHTGIPSSIVKDIIKGFEQIDYELDEILYKMENGWNPAILNKAKRLQIELPEDIEEHIQMKLPLLDKQMTRLHRLVREKEEEIREKEVQKEYREMVNINAAVPKRLSFQPTLTSPLGEEAHHFIIQLLETHGTISVIEICQELNAIKHNFKGTFSTGKPRSFPYVSMVMEQLVEQGACKVEKADLDDRWYSII